MFFGHLVLAIMNTLERYLFLQNRSLGGDPTLLRVKEGYALIPGLETNKIYFCRTLHLLGGGGPLTGGSRFLKVLGRHM